MCIWFFLLTFLSFAMGIYLSSPLLLQLGPLNISFRHDWFEIVVWYLSRDVYDLGFGVVWAKDLH